MVSYVFYQYVLYKNKGTANASLGGVSVIGPERVSSSASKPDDQVTECYIYFEICATSKNMILSYKFYFSQNCRVLQFWSIMILVISKLSSFPILVDNDSGNYPTLIS